MLRRLINHRIESAEKELGVPLDEARYVAGHSLGAFRAWSNVRAIADYHHALPVDVYYVAKISAYREEDCGSCMQISVNLAKKSGVAPEVIRAALNGNVEALPAHLRDVYLFAQEQANRVDHETLREKIRERYGDDGLIELAMGIASARTFPTFKRALGYAQSCSVVKVAV